MDGSPATMAVNSTLVAWNSIASNSTGQLPRGYKSVIDYLLLAVLISIMLAMGCEVTWQKLLEHAKKPIGILIGTFCQFGIMPLSAYTLMQVVGVHGLHATGVLIITCCPGGIVSNAFSYYCDGDLSLSVAMTFISTIVAMGMMPLNVWMYGRSLETMDFVVPYGSLAISLVSLSSPVVVGMFLRQIWPRASHYITKIGSSVGILFVIVCIVLEVVAFPNMFVGVPNKLYATVLSLPLIGIAISFLLATMAKQTMTVRKTIAIECGMQNVPTALTIINLSFSIEVQQDTILFPCLYGFSMLTCGIVMCGGYQIYNRISLRRQAQKKSLTLENEGLIPQKELVVLNLPKPDVISIERA